MITLADIALAYFFTYVTVDIAFAVAAWLARVVRRVAVARELRAFADTFRMCRSIALGVAL